MKTIIALLLTVSVAVGVNLPAGIRNFSISQVGGAQIITITNNSGANATVKIYDAPSTNLTRVVTNYSNIQRVIGQAPANLTTTNLPYRLLGTFVVTNGNYQLIYPRTVLTYGLTVSNTAAISATIQ